jgi:alpha-galactosidase
MRRSGRRAGRMLAALTIVVTVSSAGVAATGTAVTARAATVTAASPPVAAQAGRPGSVPPPADTWLPKPASYPSENGLSLTPPMGFNDWAYYGCDISQKLFVDTADELVKTGLAADGYRYVNLDDCWPAKNRNAQGQLVANPGLFPRGLTWLGDYLHAKGLKFGIYEDAGSTTCQGLPGSWGHFAQDARTFASWGVDYVKLDGCNVPSVSGQTAEQTYRSAYTKMSRALKAAGRPMVFSESAPAYFYGTPGFTKIMSWVGHEGDLWRFGSDIADNWASVLTNYSQDNSYHLARYAGPGHWNDPDMLEVNNPGLSSTEQRSQFSLWAEMAAPLLISTDLNHLARQALSILSNKAVIAVDQDPYGAQGTIVKTEGKVDILAKPLAGGDISVALFNRGDTSANPAINAHDAGFSISPRGYLLDNLWTHQVTETASDIAANVPPHGVVMYRVTPVHGSHRAVPATALSITNPPLAAGKPTPVRVTLTDDGLLPLRDASVSLAPPAGWTATATSPTRFRIVRPGHPVTASYSVTSTTPAPGSTVQIDASARYRSPGSGPESVTSAESYPSATPYPDLAAAFNNIAITKQSDTNPANLNGGFDGGGDTYSQHALDAATPLSGAKLSNHAAPGSTVSYGGVTFTVPDVPAGHLDNVAGARKIALSGTGSAVAFLGSEAGFTRGTVKVAYTDGSTSTAKLGFPNWCCDVTTAYGSVPVIQSTNRDTPSGPADFGTDYDLFYNTIPISPGKTVAAIILPISSLIHIFAIALRPA